MDADIRDVPHAGDAIASGSPVCTVFAQAETAAACALYLATFLGIPVSTTHTITGAIVGVGATRRLSAVRWGVAGRIVWAWVLTIPAAALIAAVTYAITVSPFAVAALILAAIAVIVALVVAARRTTRRAPEPALAPAGQDEASRDRAETPGGGP